MNLVCIPAYNEETKIKDVVKKSLPHVDKVIVCDDGSTDNTAALAEKAGAIVISHATNLGYGAGTGLMMGTWFAFIRKETNTRQQFRTIGTSTVLGAVLGIMLGTRSVWNPGAPRPEENSQPTGSFFTPSGWFFAQKDDSLLISFRLKF